MSTIDSLKHTRTAQRAHTASQQEAGTEPAPDRPARDYPLNPITTRGQDPELFWMNKYGADNHETRLQVDIRSLYRYEHVAPEVLIQRLYRLKQAGPQQLDINRAVRQCPGPGQAGQAGQLLQAQRWLDQPPDPG